MKYGWKPDIPDHRDKHYRLNAPVPTPAKVDLSSKMPSVYNQADLGSCTANAAGAAFQYDQIRQGINDWMPSRLMLYYLTRKLEGTIKEDAGGQIRDSIKVLVKWGVCPEAIWPYDIPKFTTKPPVKAFKVASLNQALQYARVSQTAEDLEQVLAKGHPVVFGFAVFESFESRAVAKNGMVPMPTKKEKDLGGHAVLLVGYDREKKLFKVRNSWGEEWGDKGYFYMPYAYVLDSGLSDDFWAVYSVEDGIEDEDNKAVSDETGLQ